ncbi:MAG: exodeoxyribonuclease VII large subunit [Patescibacteria group bacterium]
MKAENDRDTFSVSEFISLLNSRIRGLKVGITGEISEMKMSAKGHAYPVIKDRETGDILPSTMWASNYVLNGVELEVGMEILAKGYPEFYGPFGKLSFHIHSFELVGEGQLKRAYDRLKKKLSAEGIFDNDKKRALPEFPKKIGVITSTRGEAIHDFSNNLRRSGFKVKILHSPVEGPESGRSLTLSVRAMKKEDIDILVIMRGGGSMQSLAGFDSEALVREIASFPKPVIAGIGHHQDIPLASLAADVSESTPSMVASVLSRPWNEADAKLGDLEGNIFSNYEKAIESNSKQIKRGFESAERMMNSIFKRYKESEYRVHLSTGTLRRKISDSRKVLSERVLTTERYMTRSIEEVKKELLSNLPKRYLVNFSSAMNISSDKIDSTYRYIQTNDPQKQMRLGYSISMKEGKVIKSKKGLKTGDEIDVRVYDGNITSEIKRIK